MAVFDIAVRGLGECFDIPNEVGLHELDGFVMVIQLLLELRFLGSQVLAEAVSSCFGGNDEPVDDGSIGVHWEVVAGDGSVN